MILVNIACALIIDEALFNGYFTKKAQSFANALLPKGKKDS